MPNAQRQASDAPAFAYDVAVDMIAPVRARVGDRLIVTPGHPERPVVVVRRDGDDWQPVHIGPPDLHGIYAMCIRGALVQRFPNTSDLGEIVYWIGRTDERSLMDTGGR